MFLAAAMLLSALVVGIYARSTRLIQYNSPGTDNEKQAQAASFSHLWKYPSDMHRYSGGKSAMKDVTILLLAGMQRLIGDKKSDRPLVILCGVMNGTVAVLLQVIAAGWWGNSIGLLVALLWLGSMWIWQVAIFGGHILVANPFFLLAVLCVQRGSTGPHLLGAGISIGFMLYSSASSRKYLLLILAALAYRLSVSPEWAQLDVKAYLATAPFIAGTAFAAAGLLTWAVGPLYRRLIRAVYRRQLPLLGRLSAYMRARHPEEYYLENAMARYLVTAGGGAARKFCFLSALISYGVGPAGWAFLSAGVVSVFLLFSYPALLQNLRTYFEYSVQSGFGARFRLYVDIFGKLGHTIQPDMRGAGWIWVWKLFLRFCPVILLAAIVVIVVQVADMAVTGAVHWPVLAVLLVAVSPVAWGELTRGPQLSRSYLPGLFGLLLVLGYGAYAPPAWISPALAGWFLAGTVAANALWSLRVWATDVYPARMGSTRLAEALRNLGTAKVFRYATRFNFPFLDNIDPELLKGIQFSDIHNLAELDEGYVVIPGVSAKALPFESDIKTVMAGDFLADPSLKKLVESRLIEEAAVAKFKTLGTSRIWGNEAEITSYRILILRDITDLDRWKAHGWIIRWNRDLANRLAAL